MSQAKCSRCHRRLTDPYSMTLGLGPECRSVLSKRGWKFPKPVYRVMHEHVVLVKIVGKITPPPPKKRKLSEKGYIRKDIAQMLNWAVVVLVVLFCILRGWPW